MELLLAGHSREVTSIVSNFVAKLPISTLCARLIKEFELSQPDPTTFGVELEQTLSLPTSAPRLINALVAEWEQNPCNQVPKAKKPEEWRQHFGSPCIFGNVGYN